MKRSSYGPSPASRIPIISAVGHEIDFTISDLVADFRMPTPTAAAEWVVQSLDTLQRTLAQDTERITRSLTRTLGDSRQRLQFLKKRLGDPRRRLADLRLLVDDRFERLHMGWTRCLERRRTAHAQIQSRLAHLSPDRRIRENLARIELFSSRLNSHFGRFLDGCRAGPERMYGQTGGSQPPGRSETRLCRCLSTARPDRAPRGVGGESGGPGVPSGFQREVSRVL